MGFTQGLSGVKAANTDLNVTGNNIANASTVGFKSSRVEFGDAYTNSILSMGKDPVGAGVRVESVTQKFNQGNISSTDSSLDMAIDGQGFFILNNNGSQTYTRAGQFGVDKNGYIVSNLGGRLQGYPAIEGGNVGGILSDIQLETGTQPPRNTHGIEASLNVPAASKVLEEIGSVTTTNGLAVAVAQVGEINATRSTLGTSYIPTTAGTPATFNGNALADDLVWKSGSIAGDMYPIQLQNFDLTVGTGATQTVTPIPLAADSIYEVVSAINTGIRAVPALANRVEVEIDPADTSRVRFVTPTGSAINVTGSFTDRVPTNPLTSSWTFPFDGTAISNAAARDFTIITSDGTEITVPAAAPADAPTLVANINAALAAEGITDIEAQADATDTSVTIFSTDGASVAQMRPFDIVGTPLQQQFTSNSLTQDAGPPATFTLSAFSVSMDGNSYTVTPDPISGLANISEVLDAVELGLDNAGLDGVFDINAVGADAFRLDNTTSVEATVADGSNLAFGDTVVTGPLTQVGGPPATFSLSTFDVSVDGVVTTITPSALAGIANITDVITAINDGLTAAGLAGTFTVAANGTDALSFTKLTNESVSLIDGADIGFSVPTPTSADVSTSSTSFFPYSDSGAIELTLTGPNITGTVVETLIPFENSSSNSVQEMVNAINAAITSNDNLNGKVRARQNETDPSKIDLLTTGLYSSDGTVLTIADGGGGTAFEDLQFNATTPDVPAALGLSLFQNGGIDLLSVEGTPVSVQGNLPAELSYNGLIPGTPSTLTGGLNAAFSPDADISVANDNNVMAFVISAANGTQSVEATIPDGGWSSFTEFETVVQGAIDSAYGSASLAPQMSYASGRISFTDVINGPSAISIIDDVQASSTENSNYTMAAFGLTEATNAALNPGEDDTLPNNEITISKFGVPSGSETLTIPSGTYTTASSLADAINIRIQGAAALRDQVYAEAVNGRIVFNTVQLGTEDGNGLSVTGTEAALESLGHTTQTTPPAIDPFDRRHSFRVNLSVPLPDEEQRSGSVEISINENIRTIEQLSAAINRELASAPADDYVGVEARVTLDEFSNKRLEFVATQAGEASIISITNVNAIGDDITIEELYGMLQVDPTSNDLLTLGEPAIDNGYPEQTMTITNPEGDASFITLPEGSTAAEIATQLSELEGVQASATTNAKILAQDFTHSGNLTIYINGQPLESTNLASLAEEINGFQQTSLNGTTATLDPETGDLLLENALGIDMTFQIESDVTTDSIIIQGGDDTAPVVLGGVLSEDDAARVGGTVEIILNRGYELDQPTPRVAGLFNGLPPTDFDEYLINEFNPDNPDTYNETASMTVYDSLGNAHRTQFYYVKDSNDPNRPFDLNSWTVYVTIDGENVGDPDPTLPYPENTEATMASYKMYFNADGTLNEGATGNFLISNWDPVDEDNNPNGAYSSLNVAEGGREPLPEPNLTSNFVIDPTGTTQYGSPFARNILRQDGYASGRLKDIEVDNDGQVFARYTNGEAQLLGQVALASFVNNEGLSPIGDTQWVESFESGDPTIGEANSGTFGNVRSSSLEDSTVDLAEQLVHLIVAQRNYQASAKTIETANAVTQTIINLR